MSDMRLENNSTKEKGQMVWMYLKRIAVVSAAILVIWLLLQLVIHVSILQLFKSAASNVTELTRANPFLVKGVMTLLLLPVFLFSGWLLSFSQAKRRAGVVMIFLYVTGYYFMMYALSDSAFFSSLGEGKKCAAIRESGVEYFDTCGPDPKTGQPMIKVTKDNIRILQRMDKPLQKIDSPTDFFDANTGEAIVWYYRTSEGNLEFYNRPGFHPKFRKQLLAVTPELVEEYLRQKSPAPQTGASYGTRQFPESPAQNAYTSSSAWPASPPTPSASTYPLSSVSTTPQDASSPQSAWPTTQFPSTAPMPSASTNPTQKPSTERTKTYPLLYLIPQNGRIVREPCNWPHKVVAEHVLYHKIKPGEPRFAELVEENGKTRVVVITEDRARELLTL